jgi:hypothetical protein
MTWSTACPVPCRKAPDTGPTSNSGISIMQANNVSPDKSNENRFVR